MICMLFNTQFLIYYGFLGSCFDNGRKYWSESSTAAFDFSIGFAGLVEFIILENLIGSIDLVKYKYE